VQTVLAQVVPLPVQNRPEQQGCPSAPQPPHEPPAAQLPTTDPHAWPTPMQTPPVPLKGSFTQQLPSVQELPPQQGVRLLGALAVPHLTQRPLPKVELQTRSAVLHLVTPGQQGSPGPPHF
jgi:hypothetical protein